MAEPEGPSRLESSDNKGVAVQHILITTNSPGEVATWLTNTVPALRLVGQPDLRISVALVPCPYASGAEQSVVSRIAGISEVYSPWQSTRLVFGIDKPQQPVDWVLFLGGDPWHAILLGRRFGCPIAGYFERETWWSQFFDRVYLARGPVKAATAQVVGNLMMDSFVGPMSGPSRSHPVLAIYPGSRAWHLRASLGAFLYVGEKIRQRVPGLELAVVQSPFVGEKDMQMALDHPWSLKLPTTRGSVQQGTILTQSGLQVTCLRGRPHEVFPHFDLAVTIPGTNSAELALAGKPFILAIHELAYLGGGGLLKLLEKAPVPDSWKTYFRHRKLRRLRFLSIPNQIAGQMVAIEIIMTSGSEVLEDCLVRYLNDSELRQQYGDSLRQVMGPAGAAQAIASDLCCRPPHKTSNGWNVFLFRHRAVVLLVLALIALFIARPSSLSYRTGLALAVVAELLRVWAVGHAGRITRESVLSADQLVVGGPYAWVRNPLYLGNCLNASAVVFACAGNWGCQIAGAAALLVGLGLALFYRRLIMVEESFLLEKFGDSYRAYCQNVPRLWPRIPARTQSDWKSSQFCFGQGAIWEGTSILWWLLVWGVLAAKLA